MTRTSLTHPLLIASVQPAAESGRIGITFCPGKKQTAALTGQWDRDLGLDLDAVEEWGAAALVTLVEEHELAALNVSEIGAQVRRRHMDWLHLPIRDVSVPSRQFESSWEDAGASLRSRLRSGFNVVVHCKGGLGRAGLIAARLMVELGTNPRRAITEVRNARPGAIQTAAQLEYVLRQAPAPEPKAETSPAAVQDRASGALLGLAIGDALGTTLEFRSRDTYNPLSDIVGGGPFRLKPGQWTDDTAMALALADSLLEQPSLDEADLMRRFVDWRENGTYSCTGACFDIGATVSRALTQWKRSGDPIAGSTDPWSSGNGSLMRLAPVALRYWNKRDQLTDIAARQSATTHGSPESISACVGFAHILADAIRGVCRSQVLGSRTGDYAGNIKPILAGSWRGKRRHEIASTGYVAHSLEAALWSIGRTGNFRDAVLTAANLGHDADTTAAIAGQLAGALYGMSGIPADWIAILAWRNRIEQVALDLCRKSWSGDTNQIRNLNG